jgi:hypothetical protein
VDIEDVFENPAWLRGKTPTEVENAVTFNQAWRIEKLGRGSHAGEGWVIREYAAAGGPTGRMIRWHPGGSRYHGPAPYWRIMSPQTGKSDVIR